MKWFIYVDKIGNENLYEIKTRIFPTLKTSYIFIIFIIFLCCLILTPGFLFAGGMVYWTPNGVLLPSSWGVLDLIDDTKGGTISLNAGLVDVWECLRAIRVDRYGNLPWGPNGVIIDTNFLTGPMGIKDEKGGAIVVWWPPYDIYYQRIDSIGIEQWGADPRITLPDSIQWYPDIYPDGAKGMIVAWQEQYSDDIHAQRIDSTGQRRWGDNGIVVCMAPNTQQNVDITRDCFGNSIIVWEDLRNGDSDIYAQKINNDGEPVWQNNGIIVCDAIGGQYVTYRSSVVMASDSTVIIAWQDWRNGESDIYVQSLDPNGVPQWTLQGIPVCDTINNQTNVKIIADDKGGAIFCWIDRRNSNKNIYAQRMNNIGEKLWGNQGIAICTEDSCEGQNIIADGHSGAIVCWSDKRSGNLDIYAQHVDSLGNMLWNASGMPVCTTIGTQYGSSITACDSNTAIIGWFDRRNGAWRGYVQKVGDEIIGIAEKEQNTKCKIQDMTLEICPNPFSNCVAIKFRIPYTKFQLNPKVQNIIKIYDAKGRLVKHLNNLTNSRSSILWSGNDDAGHILSDGVYFIKLNVDRYSIIRKIVKTK